VPFPGDPRLRRARPSHGFRSPGFVENLPERKIPPTDWDMLRRQIPYGIMNILALKFGGPKALAGGVLPGLLEFSRYVTNRRGN
jgi:hypothetical protein